MGKLLIQLGKFSRHHLDLHKSPEWQMMHTPIKQSGVARDILVIRRLICILPANLHIKLTILTTDNDMRYANQRPICMRKCTPA